MLPAAGAAPGQAGPPARPQSPRSHQLQLQLRALRLPQSPAALTGKSPSPPGAHTWELLSLFPSSHRLHLRDTLIPRRSLRPSVALWGFVGWPFDLRGFSFILGATYFLVPGLHAGGVPEPSRPSPVRPRPVLSGLILSNDLVFLLFSAFRSGSWASLP